MPVNRIGLSALRGALSPRILATLLVVVALSSYVKVAWLNHLESRPGFSWGDPDGYLRMAETLTRTGEWEWTPDATRYEWNYTSWTLPPGYPVFLSAWYRAPDLDARPAALAQIAWSGLGVVALFWLVTALHSPRAGLIAAALHAFWFPAIASPNVFIQEAVFNPLVLVALAALAVSLVAGARPWAFGIAGMLLALAMLTRPLPLYFLPVLLLLFNLGPRASRPGLVRQAVFLGAVAMLIVPYVTWLSVERGRLILIDDHGAIVQTTDTPAGVPTVAGTANAIARRAVADLPGRVSMARGMLQVYGRSWLYRNDAVEERRTARRLEWVVWLWLDLLFVVVAVAAPWGLAATRERRLAVLLIAWAAFIVAIAVAAGFSGARYRSPLEFVLIAGAAVAVSARPWRVDRATRVTATAASLVIAVLTVPQLIASSSARAAYGLAPGAATAGEAGVSVASGRAGFYVLARQRTLALSLEPSGADPMAFRVMVDGRQVRRVVATSDRPAELRLAVMRDGAFFVEVAPEAPLDGLSYRIASR